MILGAHGKFQVCPSGSQAQGQTDGHEKEELCKDKSTSRIADPEFSQTLSTTVQIALVDLYSFFGVRPSVVVGHSSGEIAAA